MQTVILLFSLVSSSSGISTLPPTAQEKVLTRWKPGYIQLSPTRLRFLSYASVDTISTSQ